MTYTIEGRITKIVRMNIHAETREDAMRQAETYIENGAYEVVETVSDLVYVS